ncbi:MAG TPA: recombination mediator RecR [Candidatus Saccharibacteria bacterium]|nr:recombination mediator RecR [Candidatus Saccharibacteria bacterium]
MLPKALENLIEALGSLPGVGPRTAERYAYFVLRAAPHVSDKLVTAIGAIHDQIKTCPVTYALIDAEDDVSPLYSDPERDKTIVAIVEEPFDVVALEKTKQFHGTYHVLGGAMSPIDGVGPEELHIPELIERIKKDDVQEIILATNASVEGESTALYIQKHLEEQGVDIAVTRLARGIPVGVDLEYADMITLTHALEGRRKL